MPWRYVKQNLELLDRTVAMAGAASKKPPERGAGQAVAKRSRKPAIERDQDARQGRFPASGKARVDAVIEAAENAGLLGEKNARIGGRISPALIEQAKKRTGIETDTDLIEFALANVALGDDFAKTYRKTRGTVDPALKLGF
jgi:hypothetical protein